MKEGRVDGEDLLFRKSAEEVLRHFIRFLIRWVGDDPDREGLRKTPDRMIRMWKEIFKGYNSDALPEVTVFENGGDVKYTGMVIDHGYFFSICEHHMVPFFGHYYFGYIPDKWLVGASKIGRVIDYFSARLQVQERLCEQVADFFEEKLKPKGLIVLMRGRHLCKEMRGLRKYNSPFETIAVRGLFEKNVDGCKDEFMSRVLNIRD